MCDGSLLEQFECECLPGYSGNACEQDTNECSSNPCTNGGSCAESGTADAYLCTCMLGFAGAECQHDIDECSGAAPVCMNGGVCAESGDQGSGIAPVSSFLP